MAPDCIGDEVAAIANGLGDGEVMLLENVRFYPAETKNDAGEAERSIERSSFPSLPPILLRTTLVTLVIQQ